MRNIVLTFTFAVTLSCGPGLPQAGREQARAAPPRQYFPRGVFGPDVRLSTYKERWYSSLLAAMDEPSLLEMSKSGEIRAYRFLLVANARARSFRLELLLDGTGELTTRRAIVYSDKPNNILSRKPVPVSTKQVREFLSLLQKADFWQAENEAHDKTQYGLDGTQWVLEGVRDREYHVVDQWSPEDTAFRHACSYLMDLAPTKPDEDAKNDGAQLQPSPISVNQVEVDHRQRVSLTETKHER